MKKWVKVVMKYMQDNIEDHRDSVTGEVNCTTLAEDALNAMPLAAPIDGDGCVVIDGHRVVLDDLIDAYFEIAFTVVNQDAERMTIAS